MPGKNNNDENNTDTTFLAKNLRSSFYRKMEWTKWLQLERGVSNTMSNKMLYFLKAYPKMPQMINLTTLAT